MFNFTPHDLRQRPTVCEHVLWNHLRARQLLGLKFRRQHPLGPFIVDFVCLRKKIVIELDGPIHSERLAYDQKRDRWLQSQGYTVIRIKNEDLERNRVEVLTMLRAYLMKRVV